MSKPTNCLTCPEHYIAGGILSYASYLYCRRRALPWQVAAWQTKERKRVRPPEWCPRRPMVAGGGSPK